MEEGRWKREDVGGDVRRKTEDGRWGGRRMKGDGRWKMWCSM